MSLSTPIEERAGAAISERGPSEFDRQALLTVSGLGFALMLLPSLLASSVFPVLLQPISTEFGWSRAESALALSLLHFGTMINSPIMGLLIARYGARRAGAPALVVSALLLGLTGAIGSRSLTAFCALHLLVGLFTAGYMPFYATAATWFQRQRALAFGIVMIGNMLTVILAPLAASLLLGIADWRIIYIVIGGCALLLGVPVFLRTAHERPGTANQAKGSGTQNETRWFTSSISQPAFWLLLLAQAGATGATTSVLAHAVAITSENGIPSTLGALVVSAIGLGLLASQAISGVALDRCNTPRIMVPFACIAAAGVFLLQNATAPALALAGAFCIGIGAGGEAGHLSYFVTRYFGVRNYSRVYGFLNPVILLLSAPLPTIVGALFDAQQSYRSACLALMVLFASTAVLFWFMPSYRSRLAHQEFEATDSSTRGDTRQLS